LNTFAVIFFLLNAAALLVVPRRWAAFPLLAGACYMTLGQGIEVGSLNLPVIRLLLLAGLFRVISKRERVAGGMNGLDWIMLAWAAYAMFSSVFVQSFIGQAGTVFNTLGIYFLIRCFCQSQEDIVHLIKIMAFVLAPLALEMINEQLTHRNLFAVFGDVPEKVMVRGDKLRAQGPFSHAILAGTVGAACLPLMAGLWRRHPLAARIGAAACLGMVVASNSSGPLMSVIFGLFALGLWWCRHLTRQLRIAAITCYILLELVMKAPAYYLIARIDLTGSSTGWHRAEVIKQAIDHIDEWWFVGTVYTRHWMPYGVSWSPDHCDITNHYIGYGVIGGLPLMLLFVAALWLAFRFVGDHLRRYENGDPNDAWFVWTLGAALFAQAGSCFSVSYFDQSFVFLFLNLAVIGSLHSSASQEFVTVEPAEEGFA